MTLGIGVGTYSSIYVASVAALALGISRDDLLVPEKNAKAREEAEEEMRKAFLAEQAKKES